MEAAAVPESYDSQKSPVLSQKSPMLPQKNPSLLVGSVLFDSSIEFA